MDTIPIKTFINNGIFLLSIIVNENDINISPAI